MIFLFDVDGTLTPAREAIDPKFKDFFYDWVIQRQRDGDEVYFVTGSDKDKTIQQIGEKIWLQVNGSYQNCANQLYSKGELIKESEWKMYSRLHLDLMIMIERSPYYGKAENNIEERVGMVNVSTVGRSADALLRKAYYIWDKTTEERKKIVDYLSIKHPRLEFSIGGEISIDIYPKGKDKSQAIEDLKGDTIYFGDSCDIGGNDYSISRTCSSFHHVTNWKETKRILKKAL